MHNLHYAFPPLKSHKFFLGWNFLYKNFKFKVNNFETGDVSPKHLVCWWIFSSVEHKEKCVLISYMYSRSTASTVFMIVTVKHRTNFSPLKVLVISRCITVRCKFCHLSTSVKCSMAFLCFLSQNPTLFITDDDKMFQLLYRDDTDILSPIIGKRWDFQVDGFERYQLWRSFNGRP